jgi:UDPglucose--hexose-1-phosphate uridylyltransferase
MSELRRDPITGRWIVLTPEHTRRPSDFIPAPEPPPSSAVCPFCEGHESMAGIELLSWRAEGTSANGPGWQVRVIPNREPILRVEAAHALPGQQVFQTLEGLGAHEVIIETPRHDETLSTMTREKLFCVLWAWRERMRDLKRDGRLRQFVVVKNHGALAGARQQHAHSQLIAMPLVPNVIRHEQASAERYHERTGACVFCDVIQYEQEANRRVIATDDLAISLCPFAPRMPFETWVLPRAHAAAFEDADNTLLTAITDRLQDALKRIDATLLVPAFNVILHTASIGDERSASYHWHLELLPRLQAVGGVELATGTWVNAVPPEEAADALRAAAAV